MCRFGHIAAQVFRRSHNRDSRALRTCPCSPRCHAFPSAASNPRSCLSPSLPRGHTFARQAACPPPRLARPSIAPNVEKLREVKIPASTTHAIELAAAAFPRASRATWRSKLDADRAPEDFSSRLRPAARPPGRSLPKLLAYEAARLAGRSTVLEVRQSSRFDQA